MQAPMRVTSWQLFRHGACGLQRRLFRRTFGWRAAWFTGVPVTRHNLHLALTAGLWLRWFAEVMLTRHQYMRFWQELHGPESPGTAGAIARALGLP